MKNSVLVGVCVAILVGAGIWFVVAQDDDQDNNQTATSTTSGASETANGSNETSSPAPAQEGESGLELFASEVAERNTPDNCWTIIDGVVYDLTDYIQSGEHPGGDRVVAACGIDGTDLFTGEDPSGRRHSPLASSVLEDFELGPLQD